MGEKGQDIKLDILKPWLLTFLLALSGNSELLENLIVDNFVGADTFPA